MPSIHFRRGLQSHTGTWRVSQQEIPSLKCRAKWAMTSPLLQPASPQETNFFTKRRYLGTSSFLSSVLRSKHCGQAEPPSTDACEAPSGLRSGGQGQLSSAGSGVSVREQTLQVPFKDVAGGRGCGWGGPKTAPAARARWLQPLPVDRGIGFGLCLQGWFWFLSRDVLM